MANRLYVILSIVVGLVVAGIVAAIMLGPGNPFGAVSGVLAEAPAKDAASQFLDDLTKGNVDEAYGKTTKAYQNYLKAEDFRSIIRTHPGIKNAKVTDVQTRDGSPDQVTIKATLDSPKGAIDVLIEVNTKDGSGWKINRFTIWPHEKSSAPG
jgi:hypothetical protein